ncbi:MAG: hypothetical protein ACK48H_04845 [Microcystis sp.]
MRYLTRLFAFNHDEFVIIMRYANTSYRAVWDVKCDRCYLVD